MPYSQFTTITKVKEAFNLTLVWMVQASSESSAKGTPMRLRVLPAQLTKRSDEGR